MLAALPEPISQLTVPEAFSPSRWSQMEKCAVSVWADREGVLPEPVSAIVGRVLHEVREQVLKQNLVGPAHADAVGALIETARTSEENRIEASADPLGVSLVEAYGARRWLQRAIWLQTWARGLAPREHRPREVSKLADVGLIDSFAVGAEKRWSSVALRLRGRPDDARFTENGEVEVTDYKTGFVIGGDGMLSPTVETQLHLYLLMAEALTGRRARGLVHAGVPVSVAWNDDLREETDHRVRKFGERFPAGAKVALTEAATPGIHCSGCRLRPRCVAYLRQVPSWWANTGDHPRPLPDDVWGRATSIVDEQIGVSVRLTDVVGRRVLVRGLNPTRGLQHSVTGDTLFMFDLEATEDATLHGRRMHARSFHERSPGPRWPAARRTRAYTGPAFLD